MFILHHPHEVIFLLLKYVGFFGFLLNENFFIGSQSPSPIKRSPKRLTGLRFIYTAALDVTAILGTVVCNYWICLYRRNLDTEALACKFFNEVNEASTFSNSLYDLPSQSAAVSDLQMRKTFRRGAQGGRGSDTKHQPSLCAVCTHPCLQSSQELVPAVSPWTPGLRGWYLLLQGSLVRPAGVRWCSHHILPVAWFSPSRAVIRGTAAFKKNMCSHRCQDIQNSCIFFPWKYKLFCVFIVSSY